MISAVGLVFVHCRLSRVLGGTLSDVKGSWRVEVDMRDPQSVVVTHRKTQGKQADPAALELLLSMRLALREPKGGGEEAFVLEDFTVGLPRLELHQDVLATRDPGARAPPQHGLSSRKMAPITSDCGIMSCLGIKWP